MPTDLPGHVLTAGVQRGRRAAAGRLAGRPQGQQGPGQREPRREGLLVGRGVRRPLLVVRVHVLQTLVVGGRWPVPVTTEAASKEREEPRGGPDGVAPHLLHGGPHRPLDEDPSEAGHAEEHRDGQQDVGHQAEQHGGPVDLERREVRTEQISRLIMSVP